MADVNQACDVTAGTARPVAWIAGVGAPAGLGAALAQRFAAAGFHVALTGRDAARVEAVASQVRQRGGSAAAVAGDLTSPPQVRQLAAEVERLGTLRAAIYNAGNMVRGSLSELTPDLFESTWRVGAYGAFLFSQASVPQLLAGGGGSLLFTGATASVRGGARFVAFASAKAALRSLAQSLARDYGPRGIHVSHVIIDGGIDGERLRAAAPERVAQAAADGLLDPQSIAETYWQLHVQPRSAWTHELDLRPFSESF
jgi:NAD(P)-dependent dehydrogenase (short-subunit alcohol dehydrogenase family)